MIEDYYKNNCQTRYYTFVNGYGGIEELEKETNKFTSGNNIVTHSILKEYAQKAANNTTIKEIYEKSFIEYILIPYVDSWGNIYYEYDPIYDLPDPKEVTKEESDALTYAFINFIRENMER